MKTEIIPAKDGHKAIHFKKGALHSMLHVKQDEKIPKGKMMAALHGDYGKLAASRARFAKNVLTGGR